MCIWKTYVLHHADRFLGLCDKLIFGLFNLFLGVRAQLCVVWTITPRVTTKLERRALHASFDSIKRQP